MANTSKIVTRVELQVDGAMKSLTNYKSKLDVLKNSINEVENSEKTYGATTETTALKLSLKQRQMGELDKEYKKLTTRQEELIKKQEETNKLSKSEQKELDRVTKQVTKLGATRAAYANDVKGLTSEMDKLARQEQLNNKSLKELQKEYDTTKQKLDDYNKQVREGVDLTEKQEKEFRELKTTVVVLESAVNGYTNTVKKGIKDTKEWQTAVKNLKSSMGEIKDGWGDIKSGVTTLATPAVALGTAGFTQFMEREETELSVMRFARGDDSQNKLIEDQMREIFLTRPEGNSEIAELMEQIVKTIEPENYGSVFGSAVEDVLNFAMTTSLSYEEAGQYVSQWMTLTNYGWGEVSKLTSSINQLENDYGVDAGDVTKGTTMILSQAQQIGLDFSETVGLVGAAMKTSTRGPDAAAQGLLETMGLLTDARVVEDELTNLQKDLMVFTGSGSLGELINKIDTDGMTVLLQFIKGIQMESEYSGQNLGVVMNNKDYLSGGRVASETLSNLIAMSGQLPQYTKSAQDGFNNGTVVDEEAEGVLNLTKNQLKLFWKEIESALVELGGAIQPHLQAFLGEMEPHIEKIRDFAKWLSGQDPEVVGSILATLVEVFAVSKLLGGAGSILKGGFKIIKGGTGVLKNGIDLTKLLFSTLKTGALPTAAATKGFAGLTAGMSGAAAQTGGAVGLLGKFGGVLAGLASPLGLATLAIGGLTATVIAQHKLMQKRSEEAVFAQGGSNLSEEQQQRITEDVGGTRSARSKTQLNMAYEIEVTYTNNELHELETGVKNQVEEIKETLDKTVGEFEFTLTGNAELDAKMSDRAKQERDEAATKKKEADDLQLELLGIYTEAIESGGTLTSKQITEIQRLQTELDLMYAKYTGGDEESSRSIYASIQNQGNYGLLTNKEAETLSKELDEEVSREKTELNRKLALTDSMLANGSITKAQAELQRAKDIEHFESVEYRIMAEAAAIRASRSWIQGVGFDDAFKDNDGYSKRVGKDMAKLDTMQNIGAELIVDTGERETAYAWIEFIESVKNNKGSLESFFQLGTTDLFNTYTIQNGTEAMLELQTTIASMLPRETQLEMSKYINLLVQARHEAGELSDTEFRLYVENNLLETVGAAIEAGDLWENTEFRDKFLAIDLNTFNADFQVKELLNTYDTIPDELITAIRTEGAGVSAYEIRAVRNQMLELDGTIATVRINTINGASQVSKNTIVSGNMQARMKALGFSMYADGTGSHGGGLAWLGDGGVSEPFLTPDGTFGISPPDWTLYDLPRMTKVWPSIDSFLGNIPKYAKGTSISHLDRKFGLESGVSNTSEEITNINIEIGANTNITERQVEKAIQRALNEKERRKTNIGRAYGVSV